MKKILLLTCTIILIPYLIVNFFVRDDEIKFKYGYNDISNLNVRVKREKTNDVVTVPFEDYIVGVLAGEMPVNFEKEALKAQAVAARSYVLEKLTHSKDKEYDVVDTVMNQVYLDNDYLKNAWGKDYTTKINKVKTAVLETYNEYLDYQGQVADAMFFSTSVGYTENSEEVFSSNVPYLRSVSSQWDTISPVFEVKYTFSLNEFCEKLDITCSNPISVENTKTTSTGRIKEVKINNKILNGSTVVTNLKLKSNFFTITQDNDKILITTKGYGHGVGMSQYGAQAMALNGYSYKDILLHYYQGTSIKKI